VKGESGGVMSVLLFFGVFGNYCVMMLGGDINSEWEYFSIEN